MGTNILTPTQTKLNIIVSLTFHTFWIVIETLAARHPEIDTDHKESLP